MERLAWALALFLALAVAVPRDTLRSSPVWDISVRYLYNVTVWEAANVPAKWLYWLGNALLPVRPSEEQRLATVRRYFQLKQDAAALEASRGRAMADSSGVPSDTERRLEALRLQMENLRPQVEETLEAAVTDVLREGEIPLGIGKMVFPPVDFSLDPLPTLLVVSPRDRIELKESTMLAPELPDQVRETLEGEITRELNLSALVEGIGGISTYPSIVQSGDLRGTLIIASHEWLHNYLFFRALGQSYYPDRNMAALNETTANIFGEELGNLVFARLTGEAPPRPTRGSRTDPCPEGQFCFSKEMRQTRLQTDKLLEEGKVEEAEAYMDERRQVFVGQGYYIRKLNQAYFAFHGTYADSPASVSPVYQQLLQLRDASPSLGAFIKTMARISSYEQFVALLERTQDGG